MVQQLNDSSFTLIVSVQALRGLLLVEGRRQAREREQDVDSNRVARESDPDFHPDHWGRMESLVEPLALPA